MGLKRTHGIIIVVALLIIIAIAVIIGLAVGLKSSEKEKSPSKNSLTSDYYENGAVATDAADCSKIGRDILKDGGSAVDAAIGSLICTGVVNFHSTGIGGGGFMTYYDRSTKKVKIYDYREYGPAALTPELAGNDANKLKYSGLAVGVPGELRGLKKAHENHGKLKWNRLIQPSVDLAMKGTPIGKHMFRYMNIASINKRLKDDDGLREILFKSNGEMLNVYDKVVNNKYADSLKKVADNYDAINDGVLSKQFVEDVNKKGGNMTLEDLKNFEVLKKTPLSFPLPSLGLTVHTTPLPGGGTVLKHLLEMIEGYKFNKKDEETTEKKTLLYHRLAEIFKFSYSKRPYLGDPDKVSKDKKAEFDEKVKEIQDTTKIEALRKKINDSYTQDPSFYDEFFVTKNDKGTTHVSVIDKDGNAVAATDTINYSFGAKFRSTTSGIIYNNELADYFINTSYASVFPEGKSKLPLYNQPGAGRRPLSSTCPAIITNKDGDVVLVVGGSGGTKITLSTAWVIAKKLYLDYTLSDAINDPRLYHTFSPNKISSEKGREMEQAIIDGLKLKGHEFSVSGSNSVIQGIFVDRPSGKIYAKSDERKEGVAAGY